MAKIAARYGPLEIPLAQEPFKQLLSSIVSQQISGRAAEKIFGRLLDAVGDPPAAERIMAAADDDLRRCGLSANKLAAIRDLAQKVATGELPLRDISTLDDEEVIRRLVTVRGIGHWTAQSFLLFTLGRPDVLLAGDLGVRKGVQLAYGLAEMPSPAAVKELARASGWHPYASAATFYFWRVVSDGAGPPQGVE